LPKKRKKNKEREKQEERRTVREENKEKGEQGKRRAGKEENKKRGEQRKRRTRKEKRIGTLEDRTTAPVPVHPPYNTSVASSATMEICRLGTLSLSWDASADNTCEKKRERERTRKSGVRD
jgi:hypothetical protein